MTFKAAGSLTSLSNSGAVNVPLPAGTVDGNYVVLVIGEIYGGTTEPTVPAGFGAPIWKYPQTAFRCGFYIYGKVASSEPANYSVNQGYNNTNGPGSAQVIVYESVPGGGPIVAQSTQSPADQFGVTSIAVPALTATAAGQDFLSFCVEYNGRSQALTAAGGGTVRAIRGSGALTFAFADQASSGAGSITGKSFTSSAAGDYVSGSILLAAQAGGSDATASGVTVTSAASLIPGAATGQVAGTAAGAILTAAASLIPGVASGVVNGTLNFQASGLEFGRRTGSGISTFALDNGASYRYTIHADGLTLGSALHTSSAITLDSAGKLPNYVGSAVAPGIDYRIVAIRQADGEAATFRITAS